MEFDAIVGNPRTTFQMVVLKPVLGLFTIILWRHLII